MTRAGVQPLDSPALADYVFEMCALRCSHCLLTILPLFLSSSCSHDDASKTLSVGASAEAQGGPTVYLRADLDSGANPFTGTDVSEIALVSDAAQALSGRSLAVRRGKPGRYIGASVPLDVKGSKDLRFAFVVRASAMKTISVNVFDSLHKDNTTPTSPARIVDDDWHPVVFTADNFHYNSDPPDSNIDISAAFASIMFYGAEENPNATFAIDKLAVYRGHDEVPPEAPGALKVVEANGGVELSWKESADATSFAAVYSVYRRGGTSVWEKVGESVRPSYRDVPPVPGALSYRVVAADYENNLSVPSPEATITITTTTPASAARPAPRSLVVADREGYASNIRSIHGRGLGKVRPDVFLFAGDSITAAMLYTHTLGSWLARGLPVRRGVGTVTAAYGATHISDYLADVRPEFAIVLYGTNDRDSGTAIRNLTSIVDSCTEFGTVPILTTIPPRGFNKDGQQTVAAFNQAIAEMARRKHIPVSYAFDEMMRHDLKTMLFDGLHLQPVTGNDAAGRALRETMDQVYFALRDAPVSK